jgi:hypothetical protein
MCVRIAPSARDAHSFNWQDAGLWIRRSWFESTMGSYAAAHGCGLALVRRVTRVGTGWRLHVLVDQRQESRSRGDRQCAFESRRGHRAALAHLAERGACTSEAARSKRAGGSEGGSSTGGAAVFGTEGFRSESWAPSSTPS